MFKKKVLSRIVLLYTILYLGCAFCARAQNAKSQEVMNDLISTEKEASRLGSSEKDTKALLKSISPNALLFRPDPQNGPAYLLKSPKSSLKGSMSRTPTIAELSADGFFAYIMGTYSYREPDNSRYGNYLSVWIREPYQKGWKLLADALTNVPEMSQQELPALSYTLKPVSRYPAIYPKAISQSKDILLSSDIIFATLLQTRSVEKAYDEFLAPESKLFIDGHLPLLGNANITHYLSSKKGSFRASAIGAYVSYTRDLGFTYGTGAFVDANRLKPSDVEFHYLRIWRKGKDGLWRVIMEMQMKKA